MKAKTKSEPLRATTATTLKANRDTPSDIEVAFEITHHAYNLAKLLRDHRKLAVCTEAGQLLTHKTFGDQGFRVVRAMVAMECPSPITTALIEAGKRRGMSLFEALEEAGLTDKPLT